MNHRVSFYELFLIFTVGSVLGFCMEGLWKVIQTGKWENHSATVYGPFCIVYGIGASVLYLLSDKTVGMPLWQQFIFYAVAGAFVEYTASFFQELCFGSISWDYSNRFLNINGRTCLSMTVMWGVLGLMFSRFLSPVITNLLLIVPDRSAGCFWKLLAILMAADLLISACALIRWHERQENIATHNIIEQHLDERYSDERMSQIYNNMVFINKSADQ